MKRVILAVAAMVLSAAAVTADAGPAPDSKEVHAEGCVEPGVDSNA